MIHNYLIDYENVHEGGLAGIKELTEKDTVYLLYTPTNAKISLDIFDGLKARFVAIGVAAGKQSLDMHLVSYLGYVIARASGEEEQEFVIVSNDTDFDHVIEFWSLKNGYLVHRQNTIAGNVVSEPIVLTAPKPRRSRYSRGRGRRTVDSARRRSVEGTTVAAENENSVPAETESETDPITAENETVSETSEANDSELPAETEEKSEETVESETVPEESEETEASAEVVSEEEITAESAEEPETEEVPGETTESDLPVETAVEKTPAKMSVEEMIAAAVGASSFKIVENGVTAVGIAPETEDATKSAEETEASAEKSDAEPEEVAPRSRNRRKRSSRSRNRKKEAVNVEAAEEKTEETENTAAPAEETVSEVPAEETVQAEEKEAEPAETEVPARRRSRSRRRNDRKKTVSVENAGEESAEKTEEKPSEKPAEEKKPQNPTVALHNEVVKMLREADVDGDTTSAIASALIAHVKKNDGKQAVYRDLMKKYGRENGLKYYRIISKKI